MDAHKTLINDLYAAFNSRNIDAALTVMTDDVSWPKASEGGSVVGKENIRAYWIRQWSEFNPTVVPLEIIQEQNGEFSVSVHQVVKDLGGSVLFDGNVQHIYHLDGNLISSMTLSGESDPGSSASNAFKHRSE